MDMKADQDLFGQLFFFYGLIIGFETLPPIRAPQA